MSTSQAHQHEKEWMDRFDRIQNTQSEQITQLSENVSALTADVRTLMKNQESLFTSTNRPFQWSAFIAAISLGVVMITLVIAPMKEQVSHGVLFDEEVVEYIKSSEYKRGQEDSNHQWMRDRLDVMENQMYDYGVSLQAPSKSGK